MQYLFRSRLMLFVIAMLLIVGITIRGPQTTTLADTTYPKVTIPGSEVRTLTSTATGRTYDLYVRFPADYAQSATKKYPVLYVLDGQWDFKLLDSIYGGLYYDNFVPEMIIVGITYTGENPDYDALRALDYTPVSVPGYPNSGEAPKFLDFIKKELIPFVEANYQVDATRRILMGSSFGGLFTLYALFTEPELFTDYVAASPAVTFGQPSIFDQEAEFANSHKTLPVRLYVSVGSAEPLMPPVKQFIQVLTDRQYADLKLGTRIIEGERHAGNKPEAYNRALRFLFQGG